MPFGFFAPRHGYTNEPLSCQQHCEFQSMVKSLHEADIEVILDVVYDHTCEGDHRGRTKASKALTTALTIYSAAIRRGRTRISPGRETRCEQDVAANLYQVQMRSVVVLVRPRSQATSTWRSDEPTGAG